MLNFNCALMLVLMLRKHITWLRSKGVSILLPLDHHIDIHKNIGIIIMIETAFHTIAHLAYLGTDNRTLPLMSVSIDGESLLLFSLGYVFYICSLPEDMGIPCSDGGKMEMYKAENHSSIDTDILKRMYRFDSTKNQCVPFGYFGCGGNWNHFYTEHLCTLRCSKNPFLPIQSSSF